MSLGRPGLFVLIKDNAFLGTSVHESVLTAGYLLAICRIVVAGLDSKFNENPRVKRRSALHSRIRVPLEPSWKQLEPTCGQLGVYLRQLGANFVELVENLVQLDAPLDTETIKSH